VNGSNIKIFFEHIIRTIYFRTSSIRTYFRRGVKVNIRRLSAAFLSRMRQFCLHFISYYSQFHQHFTRTFFVQKCFAQLFSSYVLAKEALLYKKRWHKVLMKLIPNLRQEICHSKIRRRQRQYKVFK